MSFLPTLNPPPRRLAQVLERQDLLSHVVRWESRADGRSNHAKTEVFLVALDVEPGVIAVKIAPSPAARALLQRESLALGLLRPAADADRISIPRLYQAEPNALLMTFLPGDSLEGWRRSAIPMTEFATDLAAALLTIWEHPAEPASFPEPRAESQLGLLHGVIDAGTFSRLQNWQASRAAVPPRLLHGDLRPANILARIDGGALRLAGLVDFSLARAGDPVDDQIFCERMLAPIHPDLPDLLREALPELPEERRRDGLLAYACRLLADATRAREWDTVQRLSAEVEHLIPSQV